MLDHLDDPRPFLPSADLRRKVERRSRQLRRRHRLGRSAAVLLVVAGLLGTIAIYVGRRDAAIDRVDIAAPASRDGAVNVLLVGIDRRPELFGVAGPQADTLVVVRFQPDNSVRLLPVAPDLWDDQSRRRLSETRRDGVRAVVASVTRVTGIPVHHYVELDFAGFVRLVDDLGGLDVATDAAIRDAVVGPLVPGPGCHSLHGQALLDLVRARHVEFQDETGAWRVEPLGDFGRMERGEALLAAAVARLSRIGADPRTIDRISRVLADHATLDEDLDLRTLVRLAHRLVAAGQEQTFADSLPVTMVNLAGAIVLELGPGADAVVKGFGAPPRDLQPKGPAVARPLVNVLRPC